VKLNPAATAIIWVKTLALNTNTNRSQMVTARSRGALNYVLRNHFYIGEVKYKNEIGRRAAAVIERGCPSRYH
jgi:hypothetical protein